MRVEARAANISHWFLVLGVLMGTAYALFMAPLRVPDEAGHFYRAFELSRGHCVAGPAIGGLHDWRELDRYPPWTELPPRPRTSGNDLVRLIDNSQGGIPYAVVMSISSNLYPCLPYVPIAAGIGAARFFTPSWLCLMYVGRLANLAAYLFMTFWALRLLPDFHLPLLLLALMPMTLHQAASLSVDSATIGVAFLLSAYILKLAYAGDASSLRPHVYLLLAAGMITIGLCKSDVWLAFLVLLIPAARFASTKTRWVAVCGYVSLAFGAAAWWQYVNRGNVEATNAVLAAGGTDVAGNIHFVFHQPVTFLSAIVRTVFFLKYEYVQEFVGKFGFLNIPLPAWIVCLYVVVLVGVAVTQATGARFFRWQRILLIALCLLNVVSLLAYCWAIDVPSASIPAYFAKGAGAIYGAQGRHFIPFAFLFLIAISSARLRFHRSWITASALAICVVANLIALILIWNAYQARTSTIPNRLWMALHLQFSSGPNTAALRYDQRLVRRPGPSPEDSRVFFVGEGTRHLLLDRGWMQRNGFKWPDDVIFIPAADLDAIPLGQPLVPPASRYEGQLVRRPGSTAEDEKVYIVRNGVKQWIVNGQWITGHGFRWPDDVKTIPASDLDAIPLGAAIQ